MTVPRMWWPATVVTELPIDVNPCVPSLRALSRLVSQRPPTSHHAPSISHSFNFLSVIGSSCVAADIDGKKLQATHGAQVHFGVVGPSANGTAVVHGGVDACAEPEPAKNAEAPTPPCQLPFSTREAVDAAAKTEQSTTSAAPTSSFRSPPIAALAMGIAVPSPSFDSFAELPPHAPPLLASLPGLPRLLWDEAHAWASKQVNTGASLSGQAASLGH